MQLKVTEVFKSIQGEGLHVGVPSIFVRLFGCNFSCRGFSMPKGLLSEEPEAIEKLVKANPQDYKTLKDLPLARTGCDSYASWHPGFKNFANNYRIEDLVVEIRNLLKTDVNKGGWFSSDFIPKGCESHLIFTGGEPLLGWQKTYPELLNCFPDLGNITFETNGTQPLHKDFKAYLRNSSILTTFSVSPKLSISGHSWEEAIRPEVINSFREIAHDTIYYKFVVSKEEDLEEVNRAVEALGEPDMVYIMPVGGCSEEYNEIAQNISNLCLKYGYRFSPRLHITLYGNKWGT